MELRFDSQAALSLLDAMKEYCGSIQKDARDMLSLTKSSQGWNDPQYSRFVSCIEMLETDLEKTLKMQSEYMNLFMNRIDELRR